MKQKQKIQEELEIVERCLANAEKYLLKGVNIESSGPLHLDDWDGKSGHPLWVKNVMIPMTQKRQAKLEKALEKINAKERDKDLKRRKQ